MDKSKNQKKQDLFFTFESNLQQLAVSALPLDERFKDLISVFYALVEALTQDDIVVYKNFYARFRSLLSKLDLSILEEQELDAFRRFIRESKKELQNEVFFQQGLSLMGLMLEKGFPELDKKEIRNQILHPKESYFRDLYPQKDFKELKAITLLVTKVSEIYEKKGIQFFYVKGFRRGDLSQSLTVWLRNFKWIKFTDLQPFFRKNYFVHFQNLLPSEKKEESLKVTVDTLVSVESDFLISATDIGGCFNNKGSKSDLFFLNKLVRNLPGAPAVKGSLVGKYLDDLTRKEYAEPDTFLDGQKMMALQAAGIGKEGMGQIKKDINNEHLMHIHSLVGHVFADGKTPWIEPTFFSKDFGIQGRVDLLEAYQDAKRFDIIELKSGKPSNPIWNIAWKNHQMQAVCYDLSLESTYGNDFKGTTAIYYSKFDPDNNPTPLREIVSEQKEKREALGLRNEIVHKLYAIANREFDFFDRIKDDGIPDLPPFLLAPLNVLRNSLDQDGLYTTYYQEMIAFILRELITAKVGGEKLLSEDRGQNGFAGLWLDTKEKKEKEYRIIYDLKREDIDENNGYVTLRMPEEKKSHSFRKGDLIVLYPRNKKGSYFALDFHILKGVIEELESEYLTVSLFNKQTDYSFIRGFDYWAIEPDIFETNYWSSISCLFAFLSAEEKKKRLLFALDYPETKPTETNLPDSLTRNQKTALSDALAAKDYYLLQGPPGTGKTSTFLVSYVQQVLQLTGEQVFILAFTNKAVEKLCESLRAPRNDGEAIPYLRFGSKNVEDANLFREKIEGHNPDKWKELIKAHRVFVSTVATFQNKWKLLKQFISFNNLIIDEASQLTEAQITGVVSMFKKFVLIGDQLQLPAVVTQTEETCRVESRPLREAGIIDFRISLFERMFNKAVENKWEHAYGQLTDHYRMHDSIANLISLHYRKGLESGTEDQRRKERFFDFKQDHPLEFLNRGRALFIETPSDSSLRINRREARLVGLLVSFLIKDGLVKPCEIGVITPFRAQIDEVKKNLPEKVLKKVLVDTVERFQGDEKKVILFSTTIAKSSQISNMENLILYDESGKKTDRKLLVSISRASEQFIMLGNSEALQGSKMYAEVIGSIVSDDGYLGRAWADKILALNSQWKG